MKNRVNWLSRLGKVGGRYLVNEYEFVEGSLIIREYKMRFIEREDK